MAENKSKTIHLKILLTFVALPLIIWAMGDHPERTTLKESLSLLTIIAMSLMIALFYLARPNSSVTRNIKFSKIVNWHKYVGYCAVIIALIHPLLLVVPRYYEASVDPGEAFVTILTTFSCNGIVFGLVAWVLLLVLGLTAFVRKSLPMRYTTWRVVHGVLALLFVFSAVFHVVDLGRHVDIAMAAFMVLTAGGGIYLLLHNYLNGGSKQ